MARSIHDYLIDQKEIDWARALSTWSWLLPCEVTVWLVNRFGDLFLIFADGSVHMLDVGAGTLAQIAQDRDQFCSEVEDPQVATDWLMMPLVDRLALAGRRLEIGQCFGFLTLPVLGGEYDVGNVRPISVADYLSGCGNIHGQLKDLPDGTRVVLKVKDGPK